jgi:hypothetical protein
MNVILQPVSSDGVATEQAAAAADLDAFRFEVEELAADEADLETGCLSCS